MKLIKIFNKNRTVVYFDKNFDKFNRLAIKRALQHFRIKPQLLTVARGVAMQNARGNH